MTDQYNIILTEQAAEEIKKIIKDQELDVEKCYLRVGCKGGGCAGFSYILDINEEKKETDEIFHQYGINVICDPKSLLYLNGTKIDYSGNIMSKGFTFANPNSTSTCGCGNSFSAN